MGVLYKVKCERCHTTFDHQAGLAFFCTCTHCGEEHGEQSPFYCPVCHRRFDPKEERFEEELLEVSHWD
uniref:hypothetical protein n=1 Tax=Alistipes sp. TaxID=1872444 RepID=UPI0040573D97